LVKTPNQKKRIGPKIGVDFRPDEKLKKNEKMKKNEKKWKKKILDIPLLALYIVG
jgi:hypothetical protein